eukprot:11358-Heterococcus_DN1.PRE.1
MQGGNRALCVESPLCLRAVMSPRRQECAHQKLTQAHAALPALTGLHAVQQHAAEFDCQAEAAARLCKP